MATADIILRSSDGESFYPHKSILSAYSSAILESPTRSTRTRAAATSSSSAARSRRY
ncbi:hypothetical protein BDV98DRAFT_572198 [Pterulicium gracile]|uniref:BTB domain-containing protein n=1 Tax=Pterulicium gracile TaxID=1884261 RepID=A0A5C3Q9P7_9AGAR|nr:hypothetical protein BDV98DRAFT_572198 [Pterula gracilis]